MKFFNALILLCICYVCASNSLLKKAEKTVSIEEYKRVLKENDELKKELQSINEY